MIWFWSFMVYSLIGFGLEVAFARLVGGRPDRKGLLVLPLCPVYGTGACLILALPGWVDQRPWALFVLGGLTATAAEYLAAQYHEKVLGVSFWNYSSLPGNFQGKICLPFSIAWGVLALGLVYWVHPLLAPWLGRVPAPVSRMALTTFFTDAALTAALLKRHGNVTCLRWYSR